MSLNWLLVEGTRLPASWVIAPLDTVSDISPGVDTEDRDESDLVHFVPMAAAAEDFRGLDIQQLRPLEEVKKGFTAFTSGDVLFAKITPCMENGKGGFVPHLPRGVGYGSTEFHVFRPLVDFLGEWLAYFLSQPAFRKIARANMTGTAGQMRVPTKWLRTVEIPVPPAPEQTRIVAKLEELLSDLDAGVAELKAAQKKLALYRQSLLKAAVEGALTAEWRRQHPPSETGDQLLQRILTERRARWEAKQLAKFANQGKAPPKDWQKKYPEPVAVAVDAAGLPALPEGWVWASVDQLVTDSSYGTSVKCDYEASGVPVLRIPNISQGQVKLDDLKFATQDLELNPGEELGAGDFLVIRTNGSVGLVGSAAAIQQKLNNPHYFASYLLRFRCVEAKSSHRWICSYLRSAIGRRWIEARAASSAGQHNISLSTLLTMSVPLPPIEEQSVGLELLDRLMADCDHQAGVIEKSLKQSTAQHQNILRAAFSGQLVPQDPADEPASVLLERIRAKRAEAGASRRGAGRRTREAAA